MLGGYVKLKRILGVLCTIDGALVDVVLKTCYAVKYISKADNLKNHMAAIP